MSGNPRYHPSRRSRFRSQDTGQTRRPAPVPAPVEPGPDEAAASNVDEPALAVPEAEAEASAPVYEPSELWPVETGAPFSVGEVDVPQLPSEEVDAYAPAETPFDHATEEFVPEISSGPVAEASPAETVPDPNEALPRAFQLRNVYEGAAPRRLGLTVIYLTMGSLVLLGLGALGGYLVGSAHPVLRAPAPVGVGVMPNKPTIPTTLSAQTQADVDAAFRATKERRYEDARKQFAALHDAHPEWTSMGIESARATLYLLDAPATAQILAALTRNGSVPDAAFLTALMHLTHQEYDAANQSFASAVALDPSRSDYYYFWGECLRSQGKPREAAEKFESALLRNQYETAEDLDQLKLWLSIIQADQEEATGANAKINEGLAMTPRPPYSAVFAAAAREIKAGRYKEAAAFIAKGQQLTEPIVFRVIVQDATFMQESWRPELASFYQ